MKVILAYKLGFFKEFKQEPSKPQMSMFTEFLKRTISPIGLYFYNKDHHSLKWEHFKGIFYQNL